MRAGTRAGAEVGIAGRRRAELAERSKSGGLWPKCGHTRPTGYLLDAVMDGLAGNDKGNEFTGGTAAWAKAATKTIGGFDAGEGLTGVVIF